jgi:hypothetical protein
MPFLSLMLIMRLLLLIAEAICEFELLMMFLCRLLPDLRIILANVLQLNITGFLSIPHMSIVQLQ